MEDLKKTKSKKEKATPKGNKGKPEQIMPDLNVEQVDYEADEFFKEEEEPNLPEERVEANEQEAKMAKLKDLLVQAAKEKESMEHERDEALELYNRHEWNGRQLGMAIKNMEAKYSTQEKQHKNDKKRWEKNVAELHNQVEQSKAYFLEEIKKSAK